MECVVCGEPALAGIESDIGPLCKMHLYGHMGVPIGEGEEEASCRSCRRLVQLHNACYIEESGFWHEECLEQQLRAANKCPKHGTDPRTCGCWGDPIKNLVEQASKDAQSIWEAGGKHELCFMCLKFNRATSMGLPLYAQIPQRATEVCVSCFKPVCEGHIAYPPENNILGLSTDEIYCNSGWTGGCYQDLSEKVACGFEDCETISPHFREPDNWDPITDSGQCEECGTFYCDWISGHEQCPACKGYQCDECGDVMAQEDLRLYQKDSYEYLNLCETCFDKQHEEDIEQAYDSWAVDDFKKALENKFKYSGIDLDLDDVDQELLQQLLIAAMEYCDIYWEYHSEGPHADILHAAECADPFDVLNLLGAEANNHRAGHNAPLTRKVYQAALRMQRDYQKGSWEARKRGGEARRRSYDKPKKRETMSRKRRAVLRDQMRQSMNRNWYRRDDPRGRALIRAPKTVKGMRPFLGMLRPEQRELYSQALRKEKNRRKPNRFNPI